jgi:hypothetical protein
MLGERRKSRNEERGEGGKGVEITFKERDYIISDSCI